MNPHQKNKIDITKLGPDEQRLFRMYGKLPNRKDLLQNKLKERKYFDSGDYALSKAGKASDAGVTQIGREHPVPENIPHASTPTQAAAVGVPVGPASASPASNAGGTASGTPSTLQQTTSNLAGAHSHSPVKESRLQRETSADDGTAFSAVAGGENEDDDDDDEDEEHEEYEAVKKTKDVPRKK